MRNKPEKPFKSFKHYRLLQIDGMYTTVVEYFNNNPHEYPCLRCRGRGKIVDPSSLGLYETRAEYLTCPSCNGSRISEPAIFIKSYHQAMAGYNKQIARYREEKQRYHSAIKKLTKSELKAIKDWLC